MRSSEKSPAPVPYVFDVATAKLMGFGMGLLGRLVKHRTLGEGTVVEELGETSKGAVVSVQFAEEKKILLATSLKFLDGKH